MGLMLEGVCLEGDLSESRRNTESQHSILKDSHAPRSAHSYGGNRTILVVATLATS